MFDTLLESRRRRERRIAVAVGSAAAHLAIVGWAAFATARAADPPAAAPPIERPIWIPTRPAPATDGRPAPSGSTTESAPPPADPPPFDIDVPGSTAVAGPEIDLDAIFRGEGDATADGAPPGSGATTLAPGAVFTLDRVDRVAALLPGSRPPRYPAALRVAGVEGRVVLRFVVDTLGRAEPGSATVLASADPRFTAAVREALPRLRFSPARHAGRGVRMLVEMPFVFAIERP